MNIGSVMDEIGVRLATITGLRVFDFPPSSLVPPAAVVGWPTSIEFDSTADRGSDEATFEVHVLVGMGNDRNARDKLAAYMAGSGSGSIKAAIEGGAVGDSCRVTGATVSVMTVGSQGFLAATFAVHVTG